MPNTLNIPDDLLRQFQDLSCQLSPENLCCDGEISPAQAVARELQLMTQWHALERKICRRLSLQQIDGASFKK
jgi:hypothetical protein